MRSGKKFVVWAVSFMENVYGTARMKVPYRPEERECTSADDVFRLYWRYTEPERMGYMSFDGRKTNLGQTQEQKIIGELTQRGVTHIVLEKGKKIPDWFKPVVSAFRAQGGEVVHVTPVRQMPPGVDPDPLPYFVQLAWRMIYAYLRTLEWPAAQMGLQEFSAVGMGRDRSTAQEQKARVKVGAAPRGLTQEEIDRLLGGESISEVGIDVSKLNKQQRMIAAEAEVEGTCRRIDAELVAEGIKTQREANAFRKTRWWAQFEKAEAAK